MKHLSLALISVMLAAPTFAATNFEAADIYKVSMVTDPHVAPDGKRILFTRAFFDIQTDSRQGEIWLATLTGNNLDKRLLIPASAKAGGADWSPDGKRIAYIAPWLGKPQLWVMDPAEGVGHVVTSGKAGPQGFAWSPDGTRIAFVARVDAPPVKIAGMPDKPEGATWAPAPKIITTYSYRRDGAGYTAPGADQIFVADVATGAATQLTKGDRDQVAGGLEWTPDGKRILFAAQLRDKNDLLAAESDLYAVPAAGGALERLTSVDGVEANPLVSPDGRSLAYIGALKSTKFYMQPDLWVMPIGGGPAKNLTQSLDRPINDAKWSKDGKSLFVFYNDAGYTRVALLPLDGGKPKIVVPQIGGTRLYLPSSGGNWSEGGGTYAYTTVESDRPAQLGISRGGKEIAKVDFAADWRQGKTLATLERITYTSSKDGKTIEGWLALPPGFDPAKKYPLALEIHGGPNTDYGPYFSITHQLYAAAGYIVLFTNPRGSIGYGEKFANAIDKAYPGDDYDDLMSGVDAVLKRPYIDARNTFIGGGSGGGVLTTYAIGRTDRFRAAAALRPVTDWTVQALTSDIQAVTLQNWVVGTPWDNHEEYWKRSTLSLVGNVKTPTLLIDGEADYRTPIEQSEAYYQALKVRGIDTEMVRMPEAGHGMGRPSQWLTSILTVVDWYGRYRVR